MCGRAVLIQLEGEELQGQIHALPTGYEENEPPRESYVVTAGSKYSDPAMFSFLSCGRACYRLQATRIKTSCRNPVHPLQAPSHPHCLLLQNQRQHPWGDSPEVHAPALQMKTESVCTVWLRYVLKTVC